jgi:hypothetical protein
MDTLFVLLYHLTCTNRSNINAPFFFIPQKHVRGYIAKLTFTSLLHLRRAVVVLQCRWRLKAAVRLSQIEASQYKSATMIQKLWRDFQQRSYLAQVAATKIQALWRSFWTQLQYQIDLMDIITVQCRTRTWIAKQELLRRSNAIKVIQLAASKYAARKESARLKVQSTLDIAAVNCQVRLINCHCHHCQSRACLSLCAHLLRLIAQCSTINCYETNPVEITRSSASPDGMANVFGTGSGSRAPRHVSIGETKRSKLGCGSSAVDVANAHGKSFFASFAYTVSGCHQPPIYMENARGQNLLPSARNASSRSSSPPVCVPNVSGESLLV